VEGLQQQLRESVDVIRRKSALVPEVGLILGTGMAPVAERLEIEAAIPYTEIPHLQPARVESHAGELALGHLAGRPAAVMKGRSHYYEGYTMKQAAYPAALLHALGARVLIVTSASGGADPRMQPGDLMLIDDHINLTWHNPLIGPNDESLGARFPDMLDAYSGRLIDLAQAAAARRGMHVWRGTYLFIPGPSFETRAELRLLRRLGGDAIGWSTVPEVTLARYLGMEVLGVTCLTDMSVPDSLERVDLDRLFAAAQKGAANLRDIVEEVVGRL
jgi:purine-nucleoside phosphorylase